jgi:hypothetical protein
LPTFLLLPAASFLPSDSSFSSLLISNSSATIYAEEAPVNPTKACFPFAPATGDIVSNFVRKTYLLLQKGQIEAFPCTYRKKY